MATSGSLRHRIVFDCREEAEDDYGNTQSGWVEKFAVWAEVKPKLGGETILAARLQSQNAVNITVRQNSKTILVQPDWRVRDVREGKEYAIKSIIDPDDGGAWLEMLCQIGVAA
ncbi:phage head closure protein [Tardiphaga sp. 866_E4_N2_1]|uniref:phage head closure protein n=1 Tax=unclassified Tardiphaga TaxID=2631404 RepID=UPI003F1F16AB